MGLPIPAYRFLMRLPTSSARWSAWRTRLSESGGWVVLIQKVTVRVAGVDRIFVLVPSASAFIRSGGTLDRKSTRLNSSHQIISYAVFCLKKKKKKTTQYKSR